MQVSRSNPSIPFHEAPPPTKEAAPIPPTIFDSDTFQPDPFNEEVDRAALHANFDPRSSVVLLRHLATLADPEHIARVEKSLLGSYFILEGRGAAEDIDLRIASSLARKRGDKGAEFDFLASLFVFQLTRRPFNAYHPWMQIARILWRFDKATLHAAIRLIPEALPGSSTYVAEKALVLLAHPIGSEMRRFAREEIGPAAQRCLEDPKEQHGFYYSARTLRLLIRVCG